MSKFLTLVSFDSVCIDILQDIAVKRIGLITIMVQDAECVADSVRLQHSCCSGAILHQIVEYLTYPEKLFSEVADRILNLDSNTILQVVSAADYLDVHDLLEALAKSRRVLNLAISERNINALNCLLDRKADINTNRQVRSFGILCTPA